MLVACWSAKGGSGTTVVASSLALLLAQRDPLGSLLVDVAGDVPLALGLAEPTGPGLAGWLAAGPDVPADGLHRIEAPAEHGLAVLPRGDGPLDPVVVDCGTLQDEVGRSLAAAATRSVLVTRPCFLALRRALAAPIRPSEVVLLAEPGRSLGPADVEDCLGVPVSAAVAVDPAVARAVDAGLLGLRLPRRLSRELSRAA